MSDISLPDPIIVQHLSKSYDGTWVVKDLNFKVPAGCVYGFLGRNGAGKSTTIKMLTGMVCPDYGSVSLLGEDVATMTPETRSRIAYMAEGHPLYSWMTIGQIASLSGPSTRTGISFSSIRYWITLNCRVSKSVGGFRKGSRHKCHWRWRWPPIRNC
ncbi:MAG: ATP-binding cassette domain-containing protein [Planctomycetota bacterium]